MTDHTHCHQSGCGLQHNVLVMLYTFQVLWLTMHTYSHQSGCGLEHNMLVNGKWNWHRVTSNLMQRKHGVNFLPIYHFIYFYERNYKKKPFGLIIVGWVPKNNDSGLTSEGSLFNIDSINFCTALGAPSAKIKTIKYSVTGFGRCTQLNIFAFNSFFPGQLFQSSSYVPSHCASL